MLLHYKAKLHIFTWAIIGNVCKIVYILINNDRIQPGNASVGRWRQFRWVTSIYRIIDIFVTRVNVDEIKMRFWKNNTLWTTMQATWLPKSKRKYEKMTDLCTKRQFCMFYGQWTMLRDKGTLNLVNFDE